ncbi:MAG: carboxypeptidase-like regulatory domain-containing protein [Candidatus Acidiferrales bacterium]
MLSITLAPMAGRVDAKSILGSVQGLTVDATNSAVPAAHINVHGLDDNTDHEVISGDEGVFEVENLKPGRYRVTGRLQGFADAVVPELKLEARQDLRITLTFAVASQTQTVEVSAAAEQINTENGTIAGSLQNQQLTELPLNSGAVSTSPLAALTRSPAVQFDSQGNISVGGATASMLGYSVDGISTAHVRQNGALQDAYPSSERIEELKITAFNNNAEFAQIGDVTFTRGSQTGIQ